MELLPPVTASSIGFVGNGTESKSRRASAELVAIISLGVTILLVVLGQAVWLGSKIERMGVHLAAKLEAMDIQPSEQTESIGPGQNEIREAFETLEPLPTAVRAPVEGKEQPPDPVF